MITHERLVALLSYDPDTGHFRWKEERKNRREFVGTPKNGYLILWVEGKLYRLHRLAYFYMTKEWPEGDIDHINRIRDDNRWENLRDATDNQNQHNRGKGINNTSGYKGVHKDRKRWTAQIWAGGKVHCLGTYDTPEEAHEAYCKAAVTLHGDFANFG